MKGFQIDCCKTKTKVITTAIQRKEKLTIGSYVSCAFIEI